MELARLTSMKNATTRVPLITAMVIATTKLYSPNSSFETATVVIVRASRAGEHRGVGFDGNNLMGHLCVSYQVQKREEKNPDNIDEVPVQPDHLDRRVPCRR